MGLRQSWFIRYDLTIQQTFSNPLPFKYYHAFSITMGNSSLNRSKNATDNDEFYTYYSDIKGEIDHYWTQLKGKIVYCNCDSPYSSYYVKYFIRNFNAIGLKGLVSTCLNNPHGLIFETHSVPANLANASDATINAWVKTHVRELLGNGGFQTPECLAVMRRCNVVITNPPFSLFRLWYDCVKMNNKKFLVLCNMNTCLSANFLPDLVSNRIRFGWEARNRSYKFWLPDGTIRSLGYICWLTNLRSSVKPFLPSVNVPISAYPHYDGHPEVIKVSRLTEIPANYKGLMAVPITFLFKHNPNQFKIVGVIGTAPSSKYTLFVPYINGKGQYKAVIIKRV